MLVPRLTALQFDSADVDDDGAAALHFRPPGPFAFRAGQHGLWQIPGGGVHPFTIASAPEESLITLGTDLTSATRLKRALADLAASDSVRLLGPLSHFTLDETGPVVMLAQGIGVTPFRSMLRHLAATDDGKDTTLVHVGHQHPFRADTERVVGHGAYPTSREAFTGHLEEAVAAQPDATFLVSGAPAFVAEASRALSAQGVDSSAIRRDRFWGARTETREPVAQIAA